MKTIKLKHPHHLNKEQMKETALAIGYFDGIHKGHQKVILTAKEIAEEKGIQSGVMTFHPHPSVVLSKGVKQVHYITPLEEKIEQIRKLGVDVVYVVEFSEAFSKLEPEQFVEHFFIPLRVVHVVAGFDFSYGRKGRGNMELLKEQGEGIFSVTTISKVDMDGEKISSTRIRQELQDGNVGEVRKLLGRPFYLKGKVVKGFQRGRTIGYPTANIEVSPDYLIPKIGIYAVRVIHKENSYFGMASIGYNPTFDDEHVKPSIEVYIFDFNGDIYDEELKLELFEYIREEKKFSGIEQLKEALKEDEEKIRAYFSTSIK